MAFLGGFRRFVSSVSKTFSPRRSIFPVTKTASFLPQSRFMATTQTVPKIKTMLPLLSVEAIKAENAASFYDKAFGAVVTYVYYRPELTGGFQCPLLSIEMQIGSSFFLIYEVHPGYIPDQVFRNRFISKDELVISTEDGDSPRPLTDEEQSSLVDSRLDWGGMINWYDQKLVAVYVATCCPVYYLPTMSGQATTPGTGNFILSTMNSDGAVKQAVSAGAMKVYDLSGDFRCDSLLQT